jgi:hypothetical protein
MVSNFLLASASFAHGHAIARTYLTPAASRSWRPRPPVTIVAQTPRVYQQSGRLSGPDNRANVVVSWQELAKLNSSGQYIPASSGGAAGQQVFTLESVKGQWRIDGLPSAGGGQVSHELLLPSDLFRLVYAPRNLYFYAQPAQLLVPDPVFVPVQSNDLVSTLITDLIANPNGWLQNAAVTAFPPGARLTSVQVLAAPPGGETAIVNIWLPARTPRSAVQAMAAQLVWTLTSPTYSPALIQAVKLEINGHLVAGPGGVIQGLNDYWRYVPHSRRYEDLYYVSTGGSVRMFGRQAHSVPVPGEAGTGRLALNQIAISPDGRYLAGVAGPSNTVYTSDLAAAAKAHAAPSAGNLHSRLTGAGFGAPSWDSGDDLWIAGRVHRSAGVWVIPPTTGSAVRVSLPTGIGTVTGLKVAPDGVRVALIVGQGAAAHLLLGAVVRTGKSVWIVHTVPLAPGRSGLSALTWYDEDHVLAITQSSSGAQLWEVPVNGDVPTLMSGQPGMVSITAAGSLNPLYLGMSVGRLENSGGIGELWRDIMAGRDAAYPG